MQIVNNGIVNNGGSITVSGVAVGEGAKVVIVDGEVVEETTEDDGE